MAAGAGRARLMTAREVAAVLGVSVDTVRRSADGRLQAVRVGVRSWLRFNGDEVERLIAVRERR